MSATIFYQRFTMHLYSNYEFFKFSSKYFNFKLKDEYRNIFKNSLSFHKANFKRVERSYTKVFHTYLNSLFYLQYCYAQKFHFFNTLYKYCFQAWKISRWDFSIMETFLNVTFYYVWLSSLFHTSYFSKILKMQERSSNFYFHVRVNMVWGHKRSKFEFFC